MIVKKEPAGLIRIIKKIIAKLASQNQEFLGSISKKLKKGVVYF